MTTQADGADGILALARELREAAVARQDTMQDALRAFNNGDGSRMDYAASFLRATQQADAAYEQSTRAALRVYREGVQSTLEPTRPNTDS